MGLRSPISPWLNTHPCPPNRKAFVDPGTAGGCTGLAWQEDRLSSWLPVGPRVPACGHGHSRDHLSQILLDPIQDGLPRSALTAPPPLLCPYPSGSGRMSSRRLSREEDMMSHTGLQSPPLPQPIISQRRKGKGLLGSIIFRGLRLPTPSLGFSSGPHTPSQPFRLL